MVEWKGLTIQLVSVLLGSSVIITILSSVFSGINQPDINVSIDPQRGGFGVFPAANKLDSICEWHNIDLTSYVYQAF